MTLTGKWKELLPIVALLVNAGYDLHAKDTDAVEPHDERGMLVQIFKGKSKDG